MVWLFVKITSWTYGNFCGMFVLQKCNASNKVLSFSTVKKAYVLLNEYFRTMYLETMISKNPMDNVEMIKKANENTKLG